MGFGFCLAIIIIIMFLKTSCFRIVKRMSVSNHSMLQVHILPQTYSYSLCLSYKPYLCESFEGVKQFRHVDEFSNNQAEQPQRVK